MGVVYEEGNYFSAGSYLPIEGMDPILVVTGSGSSNKLQVGLKDGTVLILKLGTYATRSWQGKLVKYVKVVEGTARPYYAQTGDAPVFSLKGMIMGTTPDGFAFNNELLGDVMMRSLEVVAPRRVTVGASAPAVDLDVASGGTGSGTLVGTQNYPGYIVYISAAISGDSLGTSPHDAVITLTDDLGYVVDEIRLGVNSPTKIMLRMAALGPISYKYTNGDSVSHWFYLNAYTVVP